MTVEEILDDAKYTSVMFDVVEESNYDNHYYRATYANRLYNQLKRDIDDIPPQERYVMRKDRAGEVYDKQAMLLVSRALGHNRISVIAQSYLYQS